jgi:hypothetical protein
MGTMNTGIVMGLFMTAVMLLSLVGITTAIGEVYAQQTPWEESSEILSDAVEDLRESGEFNEEADLNAEAIDQGTAPEEEEEKQEEQTTSPVTTAPVPNAQTGGGTYQITDDEDSFRVQIPEGWIIQDIVSNPRLVELEATRAYGELARLCPEIEQHEAALLNEGGSTTGTSTDDVCIFDLDRILIIRYPDLETRLGTTDNILTYHLQKLQEMGYTNVQIVNSTEMTINIINPQTNETVATAPSNFVEMTYSPNYAQHETRRGYLISTASNATAPNVGTIKGYSVFYEGNTTTSSIASEITTTADETNLPLPPAVKQVFDSFELIAASATSSPPTPTTPATTTSPSELQAPVEQPRSFADEQLSDTSEDVIVQDEAEEEEEQEEEEETECHPSYPDFCIPPPPPNLNCDDISERRFTVLSPDPHGLDGNDNDGIGCES